MGLKRRFLVSYPISKFQLHNVKKTSISNEPRRLCMSQYLRMALILSETTWFLFIERFLMLVLDIVPREFKNFKLRTDYQDFWQKLLIWFPSARDKYLISSPNNLQFSVILSWLEKILNLAPLKCLPEYFPLFSVVNMCLAEPAALRASAWQ